MANKYAYNKEVDEAKTARAMAKSLKISPKHSVEICSAIRGMEVAKAKAYLEDVIEMKKSVPFKRHNKKVAGIPLILLIAPKYSSGSAVAKRSQISLLVIFLENSSLSY